MSIIGTILTDDLESSVTGPLGHRISVLALSGQTLYAGALFYLNASGLAKAVPASDGTTDLSAVKVFQNYGPQIASADGTEVVLGQYDHIAELDNLSGTNLTLEDVSKPVYAVSDHEVVLESTNGSGENPPVGMLVGLNSDLTKAYVHVTPQTAMDIV